MSNFSQIFEEIEKTQSKANDRHDIIRLKYLQEFMKLTGRNVVSYYSGWLEKINNPWVSINDEDKNGFMNCFYQMDYS